MTPGIFMMRAARKTSQTAIFKTHRLKIALSVDE
nr:MAG TPA_asm: hypothetical protein [Caudoviricetes sp.]